MKSRKLTTILTAAVMTVSACSTVLSEWLGQGIAITASAATLHSGDYDYEIIVDNAGQPQGVSISRYSGSSTNVDIPSEIDGLPVTRIGVLKGIVSGVFGSRLQSVTIPDTVTAIANSAFYGCRGLTELIIPESVTEIGNAAFDDCDGLTTVTIPKNVVTIGVRPFGDCDNLESIIVVPDNPNFSDINGMLCNKEGTVLLECPGTVSGTFVIPDTVTNFASSAFWGCHNLTGIKIPNSVTTLNEGLFGCCTKLTDVTIPDSVTTIDKNAFYCCESLKNITIPDSVTSIGHGAFDHCGSLERVVIPDSVTSIGDYGFANCNSLRSIDLSENLSWYGACAFASCTSLTSVRLPDSVGIVSHSAFARCTSLTDVYIPDTVTKISHRAFEGCSALQSITIPGSVKKIASYAFNGCTSLRNVTIPESVTTIGLTEDDRVSSSYCGYTFYGCTNLESIKILNPRCAIYSSDRTFAENAVIYGYTDSTAQNYASRFNRTFVAIDQAASIVSQPQDASAAVGEQVQFTVDAVGADLIYQWQYYNTDQKKWVNTGLAGNKTATLTVTSLASRNGMKYKCIVKDANGNRVVSQAAKLIVTPKITKQPKSTSAAVGEKVKFTVNATGAGLIYQWQYFNTEQQKWVNTGLTGNKTATLTVTAYNSRNGMRYKCIVKDANGEKLISKAATLTVQ